MLATEGKAARPRYSAPALERGLQALENLAGSRYALTMTELAGQMRLSAGELFRSLKVLERERYVMRDPESGTYRLSFKLYALAHRNSPIEHLLTASWYPMNRYCQEAGESCHLSILMAGRMMVVQQVSSSADVHVSIEKGAVYSVVGTVSGRLLLSQLGEEERERFLEADREYGAMSRRKRQELKREMRKIERKGHSEARDETAIGLRDLAVPVHWPVVGMAAALASTFFHGGLKVPEVKQRLGALQQCSARLSENLGVSA